VSGAGSKRVTFVTDEILGVTRNAGAATANTFLSLALADLGHQVEILYAAPIGPAGVEAGWQREYDQRGISIRRVAPLPHPVRPKTATVTCAVQESLREDPSDVVITDDRYGSCYAAVRTRSLGLGFLHTLFVVYCHGTTAWISDAHRKVRRWPASFEVEALERATIELADAVVSPSAYMVDWMRNRGWRLPHAFVAPLLTRSAVDPAAAPEPVAPSRIRRVAFFGRLEERKGLEPFLAAVNGIDARRLAGIELFFVGKETPAWTVERARGALSASVRASLGGVRFDTELDQRDAVALLREPGTLAVMPSLLDNSPMVVYECLENGIPFLASSAGGGPELVAEEDRDRSFAEPTAEALGRNLARILDAGEWAPARPAFDTEQVLSSWQSAIALTAAQPRRFSQQLSVTTIVRRRGDEAHLERCLRALRGQSRRPDRVLTVEAADDAAAAAGDLFFVLEDVDEPEPGCLEALLLAQATTNADVVTCGFTSNDGSDRLAFFLGDPRELGVLANGYGLAALYRRGAFEQHDVAAPSDWLTLASLALTGHRIVSVPQALIRSPRTPENAAGDPRATLAVVAAFERTSSAQLAGLPTLAASLSALPNHVPPPPSALLRRIVRRALRSRAATALSRR
jgi:glycosyltransferase involved in cell wall biosynthesis